MPLMETLPVDAGTAQWPLWGTTARLVVTEPTRLSKARRLVTAYLRTVDEACSRFRDDSEVHRVAAAQGRPVQISALLADLVAAALEAARRTGGLVDPTLGSAMIGLGYDGDLLSLVSTGGAWRPAAQRAAGWRQIRLVDRELTAPAGVLLDLGAIGKAYAADACARLVADECGTGVLVSLGGDISTAGEAPEGGWRILVRDQPGEPSCTIVLPAGAAVATSSTLSRRWRNGGELLHHIIDPATCRPVRPVWRTVSVAAPDCVEANTITTAAVVRGTPAAAWLRSLRRPARLVDAQQRVLTVGGWPSEVGRPS